MAKISAIKISHHQLELDPPFRASWDTRPRTDFCATVVRVETDEGVTGVGSGDLMLGFKGHEDLFVGQVILVPFGKTDEIALLPPFAGGGRPHRVRRR